LSSGGYCDQRANCSPHKSTVAGIDLRNQFTILPALLSQYLSSPCQNINGLVMVAIADRRLTAQQSSVPAVAQTLKTGVTLPQYLRAALDATVNASASGRTLRVRTHYFVSHPVAAVLWGNIGALKFSEIEVSFNDRRLCDSTDLSFHCLYRERGKRGTAQENDDKRSIWKKRWEAGV
jgi:hypothetical protein